MLFAIFRRRWGCRRSFLFFIGVLCWLTMLPVYAALTLSITVNPDPVRPGKTVYVEYVVMNTGTLPETDILLEAVVPEQVRGFSPLLATGGGICSEACDPGERVTWPINSLASGASVRVSIPLTIKNDISDRTEIMFSGFVQQNSVEQMTASVMAMVQVDPIFSLALTEDLNPVAPNSVLTYTLTFGNRSSTTLISDAVLSLSLPEGVSFISSDGNGELNERQVIWTLDRLAMGESATRQLQVRVDDMMSGVLKAQASLVDNLQPTNEARALIVTHVQSSTPLSLSITANPDPVQPNETLNLSYKVTNMSEVVRSNVVLEAMVPSEVFGFDASLTSGGGVCSTVCDARERVIWNIGTLAAGEGVTVSIPPVVVNGISSGALIPVSAFVTDDSGQRVSARRTMTVKGNPVLALVVTEDLNPVAPNGVITYRLTFSNHSPSILAQDTVLSLPLPQGTRFVSASGHGELTDTFVTWRLGHLAAGEWGSRQLQVRVDDTHLAGSVIKVEANLKDNSVPVNETRASTVIRVQSQVPLSLSIVANPNPIRPSETLNVFYTVTNLSGVVRNGVVLEATVPDGVRGFSALLTTRDGVCSAVCEPRKRVTWNLGTLAVGEGITVMAPMVTVSGMLGGTVIPLLAFVTDDSRVNVLASHSVPVQLNPSWELALTGDLDPVPPAGVLTYRLTFANRSLETLMQAATLSLLIPSKVTVVSISDNGVQSGDYVEWQLADWGAGQGGVRQLQIQLGDDVYVGDVIKTEATLKNALEVVNEVRSSTVTRVQSSGFLTLSITDNPGAVQANETLNLSYTVTNTSETDRSGVVLEAMIPEEIRGFDPSLTTEDGVCSTVCEPRERVVWNIGRLAAGEAMTVTMSPAVTNTVVNGSLISFSALAFDDNRHQVNATRVLLVGNSAPMAMDDILSTDEDSGPVIINVLSNDTDVDGDMLTVTGADGRSAQGGRVVNHNDGTFGYTPEVDFNGDDSFHYTIADGRGGVDQGLVTMTVSPVNDSPQAVDDNVTVDEDTSITIDNVLSNDIEIDSGDTLIIREADVISLQGGTVVNHADGRFSYTPVANFNGSDSFSYTVNDNHAAFATATVNIMVTAVNDVPIATDDNVSTKQNESVSTVNVLLNDTDEDGDTLTVTEADSLSVQGGSIINHGDGSFEYTPPVNFNGSDQFSYTLSDGQGGSAQAVVKVSVSENNPPIVVDDNWMTLEDTSLVSESVLNNDSDSDNGTLTVTGADSVSVAGGSIINHQDGTFTYSPPENYSGDDSFRYVIGDNQGGSAQGLVNISVAPVNDIPVAKDDAISTDEDVAVTTNDVLLNDGDVDGDTLSIIHVDNTSMQGGSVVDQGDGTFIYTPLVNFNGDDSFTYTVNDGQQGLSSATVNVTVNAVNDSPIVIDERVVVEFDESVTISGLLDNDSDAESDTLSVIEVDDVSAEGGTIIDHGDGTFTYTPPVGYSGNDNFGYMVSDGDGSMMPGRVNIVVNPQEVITTPNTLDDTVDTNGGGGSLGYFFLLMLLSLLIS